MCASFSNVSLYLVVQLESRGQGEFCLICQYNTKTLFHPTPSYASVRKTWQMCHLLTAVQVYQRIRMCVISVTVDHCHHCPLHVHCVQELVGGHMCRQSTCSK